jgi:hypothetical protein
MLRRLLAVTATTASLAAVAVAGPQTYSSRVQTIRAGIVILDSARASSGAPPVSAAPHVWFNFDANRTVKPIGWQIMNPHAATRVTQAISTRWTAITGTTPTVGQRLSKRDAPYWEVFLSGISDASLADYDVLLVNPRNFVSLNSLEREKLRKFVDHGGLLWIDPGGVPSLSGYDVTNGFPVPFRPDIGSVGAEFSDFTHPLLSRPFTLTARDVNLLNFGGFNLTINPIDASTSQIPAYFSGIAGQSRSIRPVTLVTNTSNSETMGVAQVGAGFVVITARGASIKLNRSAGTDYGANMNNKFSAAEPILDVDGLAAAKLTVNMISLLTEFRQQGANSSKSNGSAISIGAPLLNRLADHNVSFDVNAANNGSVVYKGLVIVSAGDRLIAYDANPNNDIDGDGNSDDGLADTVGSNVDIVWATDPGQLTGPISPPVVAEVPENPIATDMVMVVDGNGRLHAFNPIERLPNGRINGGTHQEVLLNASNTRSALDPPSDTPTVTGAPIPPTVHEGMAYICDQVGTPLRGRIWVVNLRTGQLMTSATAWYQGGGSSPFQSAPFVASPTVGYISILDNSGGVDKVLYAPFKLDSAANAAPGFVSLWLGARGEKPVAVESVPGGLQVTTRASNGGGLPIYQSANVADPLNVKLTIQDSNGNPWSQTQMEQIFGGAPQDQGGGILLFPYKGAGTVDPATVTVRVDYNIDWGNNSAGTLPAVERGRLQAPDKPTSPSRDITGPLALTPAGTVYMSLSGGGAPAGLFGFREEGRGNFRCNFRYEIYPRYTFTAQGIGADAQPDLLHDNDPDYFPAILGPMAGDMRGYQIIGGPAVRNGQVFVTVRATKTITFPGFPLPVPAPVTIIAAFRSEPETPQIRVDDLPEGSVLVQADLVRSTTAAIADVPTVVPGANYTYDPESKILRLENLMTVPRGQIQQAISLSQRIYVRRPGQPDLPIDPDGQGGDARWSPLLWYSVVNGLNTTTAPLVTGDTLYVGGSSVVRSFLNGGPIASDGMIFAMTSQISPNDSALEITPGRPWMKQVSLISDKPRWPYLTGIADINDYGRRLNQTILTGSTTVAALAGGDGALVAQGDLGLYTFDRADFLVADEGRIALFDPSGEPIWSTNSTAAAGSDASSGAANVHPLVRPTRAYRLNQSDMLVVDSGANRVMQINQAGIEQRAISGFKLDPSGAPTGYAANESLQLKDPRDAVTFTSFVNLADVSGATQGDGEAANAWEYWVHYVIADAGNRRLVELVDRYAYDVNQRQILGPITVNGQSQMGVLRWHSPANVNGKQYAYNSVARVPVPDGTGGLRYVYVTGVGSVQPTSTGLGVTAGASNDTAGGNGGVIVFDPARPGPFVFNQVLVPATGANVFWDEASASFSKPAAPAKVRTLTNVASVTASVEQFGGSLVGFLMITDANGVYETYFPINGTDTPSPQLNVAWMMPNEVFRVMRRTTTGAPSSTNAQNLRAVYARRLNSDSVVIVNGYFGKTRAGTPFRGEVVQVDGVRNDGRYNIRNFDFDNSSITFELRSFANTRGLVLPVFADRR